MSNYTETVMDHFMNPRNMGEIKDADGIGMVGNVRCGDIMYIYIKVGKRAKVTEGKSIPSSPQPSPHRGEGVTSVPSVATATEGQGEGCGETEEYIKDIKFKTLGCAAAIATSSIMTEMVKGKSLDDALKVSKDDINHALGTLPAQKYHCSILSADGIKKAVEDYRFKSSNPVIS